MTQAFILIFAPWNKLLCFRRPAHTTCVPKQVISSIPTPVEIPTSTSAQVQETLDCHGEDIKHLRQQFSPNSSDMADYLKDYSDIFQRHQDGDYCKLPLLRNSRQVTQDRTHPDAFLGKMGGVVFCCCLFPLCDTVPTPVPKL